MDILEISNLYIDMCIVTIVLVLYTCIGTHTQYH